jgi:hypothetical protein
MLNGRWFTALGLATVCLFGGTRLVSAQSVTSGSISGTVTDETGAPVEAAQVQVRDNATGVVTRGTTREGGRYIIQGLEVGGPYTVTVRRIGFTPVAKEGLRVSLGQSTRADFQVVRQAAALSAVAITGAASSAVISPTKTGAASTISDSALRRLPTLNRNFTDFVQLVPQVSTNTGSLSGGGVNIRQNGIQIDGASTQDMFGLGTTGQPGASAGAKSIPLDAVKEYQVLLAPYDVRQGNFGGVLINAVTKSGTNEFHGSAYGYTRNQSFTRSQPYLTDFSKQQYGFSFGGPIVRDRIFFFVNPEWQRQQAPTSGPFIGSSDNPVADSSIARFTNILANQYGLANPGSGARVLQQSPNTNVFARVDAYLPFGTRLVLRHNYASADQTSFSRSQPNSTAPRFPLTSNMYQYSNKSNSSVAEFLSNFSNGVFNELLLNYTKIQDFRTVPVQFPQVTVRGVPRSDGQTGSVTLIAGTEASSQGNSLDQTTFEITENLTIPVGAHRITLGTRNQFYHPINLFGQSSLGSWSFTNLDSLAKGVASGDTVGVPLASDPNHGKVNFHARQYSVYVQDQWLATDRLTLTGGIRLETPRFEDTPPFNQAIFDAYGRSTSSVPSRRTISPRLAFNWDVTGDQRNQLRGGIGYFTGSPPYVYLSNAFHNSGLSGYATLVCGGGSNATVSFALQPFTPANIATPPTTCAPSGGKPGATAALSSTINTIDPAFRYPQYQKISAGFDHRFANGLFGTIEGLYTHSLSNPFYQNLALVGPNGSTDSHGRILYGTFTSSRANPNTKGPTQQVLDVTSSSGDYTYSLTGQLQKNFYDNFEGSLSYTYSQARDVATITSSTANSNYRYQRDVSGNVNDRSLTRSKNDQPHRIIATGTYRAPTKTDISFVYTGSSGSPYDYVYGNGDANADGQTQNDLVYVPKDVRDPNEILFTGYNDPTKANSVAAQQAALDKFINGVPCLRESRGRILSRNACRSPWINEIDVSVAQSLTAFNAQNLQLRLDVINFGNLLNKKWGRRAFVSSGAGPLSSATNLLTQSGNKVGTVANGIDSTQGIYTFDVAAARYNANNVASNYSMQLSLRYSF